LLDLALEKTDNLRTTSSEWQFGHFTPPVLTSISRFSKVFPHFLQEYSLIGKPPTSICVIFDAPDPEKVAAPGSLFRRRRFMLTAGRNWL
jgi:hypothetical protein